MNKQNDNIKHMERFGEFEIPIKRVIPACIDFELLYNYIKEESEYDNPDDIFNLYADNDEYYLRGLGILPYEDYDSQDEDFQDALDCIFKSFEKYCDTKTK